MKATHVSKIVAAGLLVATAAGAPAYARSDPTTGARADTAPLPQATASVDDSFDWGDAAVGAAIALGAAGIVGGAARVGVHRPHRAAPGH